MLYQILIFVLVFLTMGWQSVSAAAGTLTVVWVENGDLMAWQQGDNAPTKAASGDVQQVFIAPDGKHIAFTRGKDGRSESLWIVQVNGESETQPVPDNLLNGNMVMAVGWLDAATLYFNTAQKTDVGQILNDDLWRIHDGRTEALLAAGEGGNFTFSPDKKYIALVRAGAYGGQDGEILLSDAFGAGQKRLLRFPALSTGSEYNFYPSVFWEADSSALRAAIPDKDLIYNDAAAMTTLWRLGVDGSATQSGQVQASFFGQPHWSFDGQFMTYMQRVGDTASNQFDLMTASGDGSSAAVYTSGAAGNLQFMGWMPGASRFLYVQSDLYSHWIGAPGEASQPIPGKIFVPYFVTDSLYVYVDAAANPLELRYGDLAHPGESTLIAPLETFSIFRAVFAP